jgi:hypothetical protein
MAQHHEQSIQYGYPLSLHTDLSPMDPNSQIELELVPMASDENLNNIQDDVNANFKQDGFKDYQKPRFCSVNQYSDYKPESNNNQRSDGFRSRSQSYPVVQQHKSNSMGQLSPTASTNSAPSQRPARRGGNQSPGTYKGQRMTYAELITEAIKSSPEQRLTLQQIYQWMNVNVPEFGPGNGTSNGPTSNSWKNSIRHNLSLHSRFQKIQNCEPGKSSNWALSLQENTAPREFGYQNSKRKEHGRGYPSRSSLSPTYSPHSHDQTNTSQLDKIQDNFNSALQVTRDGLVPPRSSFRTRIPSQTMPKAPTCPPNATVQAEFQNRNVKEMLRSENNEPEEIMIRKQYPLLASIIIRDQKCNMADQYDYRPERQNYIRYAETKTESFTYDVEPNEISISSKDFDQVAFGYDPEAERSTSPSAFLLGTNETGNNQSIGNSCAVEANKGISQVALFETLESMNPEFSDVACDLIDEFDILKDYNPSDYPADIAG